MHCTAHGNEIYVWNCKATCVCNLTMQSEYVLSHACKNSTRVVNWFLFPKCKASSRLELAFRSPGIRSNSGLFYAVWEHTHHLCDMQEVLSCDTDQITNLLRLNGERLTSINQHLLPYNGQLGCIFGSKQVIQFIYLIGCLEHRPRVRKWQVKRKGWSRTASSIDRFKSHGSDDKIHV